MRLAGSRSALARTRFNYQDAAFGRSVLQEIQQRPAAMPANTSFTLFEGPLRIAPQAEAINVRSRCPKNYGSVVSQLTTSSQVRVGAIQAQCYLGDIFYWARITQIVSDGSWKSSQWRQSETAAGQKRNCTPNIHSRARANLRAACTRNPDLAIVALQLVTPMLLQMTAPITEVARHGRRKQSTPWCQLGRSFGTYLSG
jgi:hypothetical protein